MMDSHVFQTLARGARTARVCHILLGLCILAVAASAMDCSGLPTSFGGNPFPQGDFFSNFNNPCYTISLASGNGSSEYGDLNAQYYTLYFKADPRYELILLGTYPNARYYSIAINDEHSAVAQSIVDANIVPLTSQYVNPYLPGVPYAAGQQFAVPIYLGGARTAPQTGCMTNGYNVAVNALDATQRHPGMDWNSDPDFFQQFPGMVNHVVDNVAHSQPNTAGVVMVRAYLNDTQGSYDTNPHIIVRDVVTGCAYPAAYALNTLQIVTNSSAVGSPWLDQTQYYGHHTYETSYLPKSCNADPAPPATLRWSRQPEYVPATNPNASYIVATLPDGLPDTLAAAGEVLRFRVRIPTTPPTPCTNGCSISGKEQMRYMSLSFQESDGSVLASIADSAFTKDANGYATLIVGTGATIPSWVTPANGYTFLDLTQLPKYQSLSLAAVRHIIPAADFTCAGQFVPYRMSAETPTGSLMGDYMPVADYPVAANLPPVATALVGPGVCNVFPAGQPGIRPACGVNPAPPVAINSVVTECHQSGCSRFVAQNNPPITILGAGFGSFPNGVPFSGTSNYLRITDTTQNWTAGYTGSTCTISMSSWDTGRIQLVANVTHAGACPLNPGDAVTVDVWNPQTMVQATAKITVASPM